MTLCDGRGFASLKLNRVRHAGNEPVHLDWSPQGFYLWKRPVWLSPKITDRSFVVAQQSYDFEQRSADVVPITTCGTFIPPAFELLPRILLLLDDPETNGEALARLIRVDAGLTAEVLRLANSAHFSGARRADTLQDAILRVGLREIYRTVAKIVASPVLKSVRQEGFPKLDLWEHSLCAAVAAQVIAGATGNDPEVAFTLGLLHDLGKVVLAQARGREYLSLIEQCKVQNQAFCVAEKALFRTDHAKAGAQLLADWNLPEHVLTAIEWHHLPEGSPRLHRRLAALTHLANTVAYRIGHGYGFPDYAVDPNLGSLITLGIQRTLLPSLEEETRELLQRERERFR